MKISQIEKEYKIDFGENKDMELYHYLKKKKFINLAKALKKVSK